MKIKTRKSIAKRFKITKKKKILHHTCGRDHFNAREQGKVTCGKRRNRAISKAYKKTILRHA